MLLSLVEGFPRMKVTGWVDESRGKEGGNKIRKMIFVGSEQWRHTDFAFNTFCTNGMQYAAVFPLPVLALARMSLFSNARGIAFVCTRVGLANPRSARARSIRASRMCPNCVKVAFESTKRASGMVKLMI